MPYLNGKRVSQDEYIAYLGNPLQTLHTSANGVNPAPAPDIDEETGAPEVKPKRAGTQRSKRSKATVAAAIADALGTTEE